MGDIFEGAGFCGEGSQLCVPGPRGFAVLGCVNEEAPGVPAVLYNVDLGGTVGSVRVDGAAGLAAVSGGGRRPFAGRHVVQLCRVPEGEAFASLETEGRVLALRLAGGRLMVVLESGVAVYAVGRDALAEDCLRHRWDTQPNPLGVCDMRCVRDGRGGASWAYACVDAESARRFVVREESAGRVTEYTLDGDAHRKNVTRVVLSPDGQWVASADEDGIAIRVWRLANGKIVLDKEYTRGANVNIIHDLALFPQNNLCVALSATGSVHFFDLENKNWQLLQMIRGRRGDTVAQGPKDARCVAEFCAETGYLHVFDLKNGCFLTYHYPDEVQRPITSKVAAADGQIVVTEPDRE